MDSQCHFLIAGEGGGDCEGRQKWVEEVDVALTVELWSSFSTGAARRPDNCWWRHWGAQFSPILHSFPACVPLCIPLHLSLPLIVVFVRPVLSITGIYGLVADFGNRTEVNNGITTLQFTDGHIIAPGDGTF